MVFSFVDVQRHLCHLVVLIVVANVLAASPSGAAPLDASRFERQVRPLLQTYCFDCHGNGSTEGNLALDRFSTNDDALKDPMLWWKVLKNLRSGVMPPAGEWRPGSIALVLLADRCS